jgi:hypothetical protein
MIMFRYISLLIVVCTACSSCRTSQVARKEKFDESEKGLVTDITCSTSQLKTLESCSLCDILRISSQHELVAERSTV